LREDAEKDPKTPYAVNKLACEGYLSAYGNRYGIPYAVLRICVPYGSLVPSDRSYGTIGFFERQASQSKKISLFGGGDTKRTFTDIHQICQSVETLLSHGSGVFNVGGTSMSLREAAQSIAFRHGAVVVSVPWPDIDLRLESGHTVFDGSRLESLMEASNGKS
jgi:UDP-glucose 4-epimerase